MTKINPLFLAAVAGGGIYFLTRKPTKTTPALTDVSKSTLNKKGYYFENCNKIVITDEQKAYKYAYTVAKTTNPITWDGFIYDGCLGKIVTLFQEELIKDVPNLDKIDVSTLQFKIKDPKQSKFLYDLTRYMFRGLLDIGQLLNEEYAVQSLQKMKKTLQDIGIDTSSWETTIPPAPIQKLPQEKLPQDQSPAPKANIINVDETNFAQEVEKSELPVFIEFQAAWCEACKAVEPIIQKLANQYNGKAKFVKIDIDQSPNLTQQFEISIIPTFVTIIDGKVHSTLSKTIDEETIIKFIES